MVPKVGRTIDDIVSSTLGGRFGSRAVFVQIDWIKVRVEIRIERASEHAALIATRWDEAEAGRWRIEDVSDAVSGNVAALVVEGHLWQRGLFCDYATPPFIDRETERWNG